MNDFNLGLFLTQSYQIWNILLYIGIYNKSSFMLLRSFLVFGRMNHYPLLLDGKQRL